MKRYNNTVSINLYSLQVIKLIALAETKNTVINNHITFIACTCTCRKWHIVGKVVALYSETICKYCRSVLYQTRNIKTDSAQSSSNKCKN